MWQGDAQHRQTAIPRTDAEVVEIAVDSGASLKEEGREPIRLDSEEQEVIGGGDLSDWVIDLRDPEDLYSVAYSSEYLLYPKRPHDVYVDHIDRANAGEAESMYWVSRAFWECGNAPRSRRIFEEKIAENLFEPVSVWLESQLVRCQTFNEMFPSDIDFTQQAFSWLEEADLAGYSTAKIEVLLQKVPGVVAESHPQHNDLMSAIELAIRNEGYPAYYQVMKYLDRIEYEKNAERRSSGEREEPRSLLAISWQYVACKYHRGCNEDKWMIQLESNLFVHQLPEVMDLVASIESRDFTKVLRDLSP